MTYFPRLTLLVIIITTIAFVLSGCMDEKAPTQRPQVLVENGAWTWFNDERALLTDSLLYIGYVDTAGYTSVSVHSMKTKKEIQTSRLGSFKEKDDHNNPAFAQLGDGSILATYAPHNSQPFWYWRFATVTESGSVTWSHEHKTEQLDASATYSNLFLLTGENGRLYNFYRGINFDPVFVISDDEDQNWSAEQHFISSGGPRTRPYVKYASNGIDRIDMLFTQAHPRDAETNIYHAYYQDGNMYQSNGSRIQSLPGKEISPMPVEEGTLIYDADENGRAWVWDLEYDTEGSPVAVFVSAADSTTGNDLRYHYARWDETENRWNEQEIAYAGTHLYDGENHYAGGITLDPADPNTVYTSSDIHPATGDPTEHYQIYRGVTSDKGRNWEWTVITPDAKEDNIRPYVPRSEEKYHAVLWLRGRYTSYQDYNTDIIGLLELLS